MMSPFIVKMLTSGKVKLPPQGNVLPQAFKVIMYSVRDGFRLDAAKPA
jgi:proton-dependent oligopeptide transporter, POT family